MKGGRGVAKLLVSRAQFSTTVMVTQNKINYRPKNVRLFFAKNWFLVLKLKKVSWRHWLAAEAGFFLQKSGCWVNLRKSSFCVLLLSLPLFSFFSWSVIKRSGQTHHHWCRFFCKAVFFFFRDTQKKSSFCWKIGEKRIEKKVLVIKVSFDIWQPGLRPDHDHDKLFFSKRANFFQISC